VIRIFLLFVIPFCSFSQTVKFRQYKGETFRYRLTTEVYRNEKFASKTISISEHTVVKDTGFYSEEIKWIKQTSYTAKDTVDMDTIAQRVKAYRISLSSKGKVLLPTLTISEMVGPITDLNTFYVAISPALNAQKLSLKNKSIHNPEIRKGHFADSMVILYGIDCMQVTQQLISRSKQYSVLEAIFTPPPFLSIVPLIDTIGKKTFDSPNNIQMIIRSTGDKVNLFWGVEQFSIISKISNANGQIAEASMTNTLNLRMRYNSSRDLKTYEMEMPMIIKRSLKLELLE